MACSNIRYGPGVTQEVGMDLANMRSKKVGVFTDKNLKIVRYTQHFLFKTSQELRMLSNVTLNCQVAKIVMYSGSQLSEL